MGKESRTPSSTSGVSGSRTAPWREAVARFEQPDLRLSLWQIANTIPLFFALLYLMHRSLAVSYWLTLALAMPAAGLAVRIFVTLAYRLYRHPLVLFGIGPVLAILVAARFPTRAMRRQERMSVLWTNLALAALLAVMHLTIGLKAFVAVYPPVFTLAATAGV